MPDAPNHEAELVSNRPRFNLATLPEIEEITAPRRPSVASEPPAPAPASEAPPAAGATLTGKSDLAAIVCELRVDASAALPSPRNLSLPAPTARGRHPRQPAAEPAAPAEEVNAAPDVEPQPTTPAAAGSPPARPAESAGPEASDPSGPEATDPTSAPEPHSVERTGASLSPEGAAEPSRPRLGEFAIPDGFAPVGAQDRPEPAAGRLVRLIRSMGADAPVPTSAGSGPLASASA